MFSKRFPQHFYWQLKNPTPKSKTLVKLNVSSFNRGLYHEAGLAGLPGKVQFSLHKSWVLDTMNVTWLLAAFIAIVTYTQRLIFSGAGYVLS